MEIRKTTTQDLDAVMALYAQARQFMQANGNASQWGNNHPARELIEQDIREGASYACTDGGDIIAVFCLQTEPEPTYRQIHGGAWLNDAPYVTIHRVAASGGRGAATFCINWCINQFGNVRADTHADNLPMQRVFEKTGFVRCGTIYVEDGTPRIAYQAKQV